MAHWSSNTLLSMRPAMTACKSLHAGETGYLICGIKNIHDVKIGDTLVVDGYLAKDGSHTIDARRVLLPSGRSIYGGTPGDGGPGDGDPRNG